jgi:serine phosphatase RsbU (regulator of sigma subunit)
MPASAPSRVLLCGPPAAADDVRRPLEQAGLEVRCHAADGDAPPDFLGHHLVVLEARGGEPGALPFCRRLRAALADGFVPILCVTDGTPEARLAGLDHGADACLPRPFAPAELLAQARALLRIKEAHDRLAGQAAEVHRVHQRLQQAYQQIDQELALARRIQAGFLPQELPQVPGLRFAVHYRLCGQVGGDFYDAFRLDEGHVGFYVADAMGHGVPASLLTIFLKKGVRAKEISGQSYRLLPPGEVLQRLNRDLIDQALAEHPFITMVYALLDHRTGALAFARAGHPHPLHVPARGAPQFWRVHGSLLGVFETTFPVQARQLRPGDKLLLYSDGAADVEDDGRPGGADALLASAQRHRARPVEEFVEQVALDLSGRARRPDDLTLLGLEYGPARENPGGPL